MFDERKLYIFTSRDNERLFLDDEKMKEDIGFTPDYNKYDNILASYNCVGSIVFLGSFYKPKMSLYNTMIWKLKK